MIKNKVSRMIETLVRAKCTITFKVYGNGKGMRIKVEECTFWLHVSRWLISLYYAVGIGLIDDAYKYVLFVLILLLLRHLMHNSDIILGIIDIQFPNSISYCILYLVIFGTLVHVQTRSVRLLFIYKFNSRLFKCLLCKNFMNFLLTPIFLIFRMF